jgi:hypothetical protein
MTYDEYRRFALMIVHIMKDFERSGEENVVQSDIINRMVQEIELEAQDRQTSIERSVETSIKIGLIIDYLIKNENILLISQDARNKNDRYLTLNVNVDMENVSTMLQGSAEPVY